MQQANLGFTMLAIIYSVFALANFISAPIVDFAGLRITMILVRSDWILPSTPPFLPCGLRS